VIIKDSPVLKLWKAFELWKPKYISEKMKKVKVQKQTENNVFVYEDNNRLMKDLKNIQNSIKKKELIEMSSKYYFDNPSLRIF
jgi:hypothetical protein